MNELPLTPAALAQAIIARQPKGVTQYRLLKLAYLAETRFAAETGRRLSKANYFSFDYGPYSKDLVNAAKNLPDSAAKRVQEPSIRGAGDMIRFIPGAGATPSLSEEITRFLDSFFSAYGRMPTKDIVAEAYRSGQYPETPPSNDIDFGRWIAKTTVIRFSSDVIAAVDAAVKSLEVRSFDTLMELESYLAGLPPANAGP